MKTKLLRKIRKRYSIYRCDEIPKKLGGDFSRLSYFAEVEGLPFYYVFDNTTFRMYPFLYSAKDVNSCKAYILEMVRKEYYDKIKKTKLVTYKVWG